MNTLDIIVSGFRLEVIDCPHTGAVEYHATFANGLTLVHTFANKSEEYYKSESAVAELARLALLYANNDGDVM